MIFFKARTFLYIMTNTGMRGHFRCISKATAEYTTRVVCAFYGMRLMNTLTIVLV